MKKICLIFCCILTTNSLIACLAASQNRIFPLGQTSGGLCAVETQLIRTAFSEKIPGWSGVSYFKKYDAHWNEVYSIALDSLGLFPQSDYEQVIQKTFQKGMDLAKKNPDFIVAKPLELTFCDFCESNSSAELLFDTLQNKVMVSLRDGQSYPIDELFNPNSIASNVMDFYAGFDEQELSAKTLNGNLYIGSLRSFQIGDKHLVVVHLSVGQKSELETTDQEIRSTRKGKKDKIELRQESSFTVIDHSIFLEPVLTHGNGFDFSFWK